MRRRCGAPTPARLLRAAVCSAPAELTPRVAQPGQRWTLWVKRKGGAGLCKLKDVDPDCDVYDLAARWASELQLGVHPERVTLRLVPCASADEPSEAQEQAASGLYARRTLRGADVEDGSLLLAEVAAESGGSPGAPARPRCAPTRVELVHPPAQVQTALAAAAFQAGRVSCPPLPTSRVCRCRAHAAARLR